MAIKLSLSPKLPNMDLEELAKFDNINLSLLEYFKGSFKSYVYLIEFLSDKNYLKLNSNLSYHIFVYDYFKDILLNREDSAILNLYISSVMEENFKLDPQYVFKELERFYEVYHNTKEDLPISETYTIMNISYLVLNLYGHLFPNKHKRYLDELTNSLLYELIDNSSELPDMTEKYIFVFYNKKNQITEKLHKFRDDVFSLDKKIIFTNYINLNFLLNNFSN